MMLLEIEFTGEFLDFRIFRDGTLIEPIMPGRQVIEANSDQKKRRFIDQAYAGSLRLFARGAHDGRRI